MAKQVIGVGTAANDGLGDTLRAAMIKANANFTELYTGVAPPQLVELVNTLGWGMYVDNELAPVTQTITTTPNKLQINGLGGTSNSSYLPLAIRGSGQLWDVVNDKITPINAGDGYTIRIDIEITAKTGLPTELVLDLDIGGGATPTTVIVERIIGTGKTPPYVVSVGFPIFTLTTFKANGGQLFLSTDSGTVTIASRQISIHRISSGNL